MLVLFGEAPVIMLQWEILSEGEAETRRKAERGAGERRGMAMTMALTRGAVLARRARMELL